MNKYLFRVRDAQGKLIQGNVIAESEEAAIADLRKSGNQIEYVTFSASVRTFIQKQDFMLLSGIISELSDDLQALFLRVPSEVLALFFRQMAVLYRTGFPLMEVFSVLKRETWPCHLSDAINDIKRSLEAGISLSKAIERHSRIFSPTLTNMVSLGEKSGNLQVALEKAAEFAEEEARIKKRISTALIYPGFLFCTFIFILLGLIFFFLPQMKEVLDSLNVKTSGFVNILMALMKVCGNPLVIIGAVEVLIINAFVYYCWIKWFRGKVLLDRLILSVPVLGSFMLNTSLSRCAFNLNLLLGSGVTLIKTLEIIPRVIGNESLAQDIIAAKKELIEGGRFSDALEARKSFPRIFTLMIRAGEESGDLAECARHLSQFYGQEVEVALYSFLSILEPLIIILMGLLVGGFFLSFLPLINQLYRGLG